MQKKDSNVRKIVRDEYSKIAKQETCCCKSKNILDVSKSIGYSNSDVDSVPEGANLGLGCGNPVALASLKEGETVLDLGSGAGIDCFLAANRVGDSGKVIGVDMTDEMIKKARENAIQGNYKNVEFRLGEIENIPVDNSSVDVIISNCVINLSPDKKKVFEEAFRILKPGGRIMVSDIVLLKNLPGSIRKSISAYIGCVAGAIKKQEYINLIREVGFKDIRIIDETVYPLEIVGNDIIKIDKKFQTKDDLNSLKDSVSSIKISAIKPN